MAEHADPQGAQATIAAQAAEIGRLRTLLDGCQFVDELRQIVSTLVATATISRPLSQSQLLVLIVRTAAHVIHARAGSVLLVDASTQELVFEATATEDVTELRRVRIPLGQGIAGLVALTGQAMAVADAQSDPRHAAEVAHQTGYLPQSLVCVPLIYHDEVIGVLELLDKEGASGFDAIDIDSLGLFAQQAAVAIEQSRIQADLAAFLMALVRDMGAPGTASPAPARRLTDFAAFIQSDSSHRRSLELASVVREIAEYGDDEAIVCRSILGSFAEYLRERSVLSVGLP